MSNNIKTRGNTAERILDVATKYFAQTGFECTNLRDIANEVGIREPSIYRHFKNKEELYKQVLLNSLEPLAETILAIIQANPDPREVLEVPSRVLAFFAKNPHVASLLQQAVAMPGDRIEDQLLDQWLTELLDIGKQAIRNVDFGALDETEVSLWLVNLFNLLIGYYTNRNLLQRLCGKQPDDPEVLMKQEKLLKVVGKAWLLTT